GTGSPRRGKLCLCTRQDHRHDLHQPPFRHVKNNCVEQLLIASLKVNLRPQEYRRQCLYMDSERIRLTATCPPSRAARSRPAGCRLVLALTAALEAGGDTARSLVHTGALI